MCGELVDVTSCQHGIGSGIGHMYESVRPNLARRTCWARLSLYVSMSHSLSAPAAPPPVTGVGPFAVLVPPRAALPRALPVDVLLPLPVLLFIVLLPGAAWVEIQVGSYTV